MRGQLAGSLRRVFVEAAGAGEGAHKEGGGIVAFRAAADGEDAACVTRNDDKNPGEPPESEEKLYGPPSHWRMLLIIGGK